MKKKKPAPGIVIHKFLNKIFKYCLVTTETEYNSVLDGYEIPSFRRHSFPSEGTNGKTYSFPEVNLVVVAVLPESLTPVSMVCLMVHEAVHTFQFFCFMMGEESPSLEFEAYSIQKITQDFLEDYISRM